MHLQLGSAGQFLPGIEFKLEPVEGIQGRPGRAKGGTNAGRLLVRGPNIMKGYVNPEANAQFQSLNGWYDTGDVVEVDSEGYLHILGRLKRFAKISGEMVSLTAVEDALSTAFPEFGPKFAIAVIARPDPIRGEKLVAVSTEPKLTLTQIREAIRAHGLSNLAVPKELTTIHELPRLGTGKINHRELANLLQESTRAAVG